MRKCVFVPHLTSWWVCYLENLNPLGLVCSCSCFLLDSLAKWSSHKSISERIHEYLSHDTNQSRSPPALKQTSQSGTLTFMVLHKGCRVFQQLLPLCYVQLGMDSRKVSWALKYDKVNWDGSFSFHLQTFCLVSSYIHCQGSMVSECLNACCHIVLRIHYLL